MKKALLVGFYESSNLGDLALSYCNELLVRSRGYAILRYDFCTARPVPQPGEGCPAGSSPYCSHPSNSWRQLLLAGTRFAARPCWGEVRAELLCLSLSRLLYSSTWRALEAVVRSCDCVCLSGGNMFMDLSPIWPALVYRYSTLAARHGKPLFALNVGAGPLRYRASRKLLRKALRGVAGVSVRDSTSARVCSDIVESGRMVQSADPVFLLPVGLLEQRLSAMGAVASGAPIRLGVCVLGEACFARREEHEAYLQCLVTLLDRCVKHYAGRVEFVFFSTETRDYTAVRAVRETLSAECRRSAVIAKPHDVSALVGLMQGLHFLLGGRMHSLIFAHRCLVPHIGVIWQDKIRGFAELTGGEDRVYNPEELASEHERILDTIATAVGDEDLIRRMDRTNDRLARVVASSCVL